MKEMSEEGKKNGTEDIFSTLRTADITAHLIGGLSDLLYLTGAAVGREGLADSFAIPSCRVGLTPAARRSSAAGATWLKESHGNHTTRNGAVRGKLS